MGLCLLATGCVSGTGLGRATTLPRGTTQASTWVEASALTARLAGPITVPWGLVGLGVRRGVHERVELGLRVSGAWLPWLDTIGGLVDAKVQLRRRPAGLDVALAQSAGWRMVRYGGAPWHAFDAVTTLLVGYNLGRHQLVGGVRGGYQVFGARGQELVHLGHLSLSLGAAFALSSRWELTPEVAVGWTPTRFNGESDDDSRRGTGALQLSLALSRAW